MNGAVFLTDMAEDESGTTMAMVVNHRLGNWPSAWEFMEEPALLHGVEVHGFRGLCLDLGTFQLSVRQAISYQPGQESITCSL